MSASSDPSTTLQINRQIAASRARVYNAWTDLDLARQWWGPEGCETHELTIQAHPKGIFRWVLSGPDGDKMTAHGEFREIRPGERIVYTWQWADDPDWANVESLVTVEFTEKDAHTTKLRLTHENLPSQRSRDNHTGSWNSALDKLERLLESQLGPSAAMRPV